MNLQSDNKSNKSKRTQSACIIRILQYNRITKKKRENGFVSIPIQRRQFIKQRSIYVNINDLLISREA